MTTSINIYTVDATTAVTKQFAVNFTLGYLSRDHVTAFITGELDGSGNQLFRTLSWINDGLVELSGTLSVGNIVNIQRTTPADSLIHDFQAGSVLKEQNLDQAHLQALMILHEVFDGRNISEFSQTLNMQGNDIINVGQLEALSLVINGFSISPESTFVGVAPIHTSVDTISDLKDLDSSVVKFATTGGYYSLGGGGEGFYYYDPLDTTTPDDGFLVHVATDGARWKLVHSRGIDIRTAGAVSDGITDDTESIHKVLSAAKVAHLPEGTTLTTGITVGDGQSIQGKGRGISTLRLKAGSNSDVIKSTLADEFIAGTETDFSLVPSDIILRDFTLDGNWADWTFPRSPTDQPVYNTSGNGVVLYSQRVTVDLDIINCPDMFLYYQRAATESIADGLNRHARGRINIDCRYCGKEGAAFIDADVFVEHVSAVGTGALMNTVTATSSSLINDVDGDVAGIVIDGGEYGNIHVSGPHQGDASDDGPSVKIVGGIVTIADVTTENSRSGLYIKSGQSTITGCTLRELKDTIATSYLLKIDSDFNIVNGKLRRFTGNASNADSDIESVVINGSSNSLDIVWFNATNALTSNPFQGDGIVVNGDTNIIRGIINAAKDDAVRLSSGAAYNRIDCIVRDSGVALSKQATVNNDVVLQALNCTTGISASSVPTRDRLRASIQAASGGTIISGSLPTLSNGASWEIVGKDSVGTLTGVTEIRGVGSGTILTGNTFALVTINLATPLLWSPSVGHVNLNVSSTTTTMVTAQIYAVSTTQLTVRLATPDAVGSDLTVSITFSIDLNY